MKECTSEFLRFLSKYEELEGCFESKGLSQNVMLQASKNTIDENIEKLSEDFIDMMDHIETEIGALVALKDETAGEVGREHGWWKGINIFTSDISIDLLHRLQQQSTPQDISYVNYVHDAMHSAWDRVQVQYQNFDRFMEPLMEEIERISFMPNGVSQAAVELYVEVKIEFLSSTYATHYVNRFKYHQEVDMSLSRMLRERPRVSFPFLNLARICLKIREKMDLEYRACGGLLACQCPYNALLPTLDTFQRHAYLEIKSSTLEAVSSRLPHELIDLISKFTMAPEGIPLDPRVFVHARSEGVDCIDRTTRMACVYVRERSMKGVIFGEGKWAQWGSEWTELTPDFPHRDHARMDYHLSNMDYHLDLPPSLDFETGGYPAACSKRMWLEGSGTGVPS